MLSVENIASFLEHYLSTGRLYIAYSGGLDSHVLLHVCTGIPHMRQKLSAVYVHHGLQAIADDWEEHCRRVTEELVVDYLVLRVNAKAERGQSPEEAARNARYQAFAELLEKGDVLLLAQHQDDQLETVLLQLFRGAGLKGLAGMPAEAPLGQGLALRPFLEVSRQELEAYALQQQLTWVEDPTNQSYCFDRNYLRLAVLPLLKQRWPRLASTVGRSARHCGTAQEALDQGLEAIFQELFDAELNALNLTKLRHFTHYQQCLVVRHWFKVNDLRMPSEAVLKTLFEQVIVAEESRDPELCYQGYIIRRFRQYLYCFRPDDKTVTHDAIDWPAGKSTIKLGSQKLSYALAGSGIDFTRWQTAKVTVRFRQGGEKISLPGRQGRHNLKKLFQEAAIPPWQRDRIPLIFMDGLLVAVANLWVSSEVWVEGGEGGIQIGWQA